MSRLKVALTALLTLLFVVTGGLFAWRHYMDRALFSLPATAAAARLEELAPGMVVAPGFVEPVSKELRLGFDISGVLDKLLVKEGQEVRAGQPLARLRQDEQQAALETARANLLAARADHDKHMAGARPAEIEKAQAALLRAETLLEQCSREVERREVMIKTKSIGIEELERALRDARVARYELDEARHQYSLVKELYRKEDIEIARRKLEAAEGEERRALAALDKTVLRSPVNGRVLRIFSDPGEAYSIFAPSAVLSVGDTSAMKVRVEVDERDIARVARGQKAYVSADAFGDKRFSGHVSSMELSMTPKRTRSGDPSEPVDRSVLEVLVTLDAPEGLYSGLRVDSFIATDSSPMASPPPSFPASPSAPPPPTPASPSASSPAPEGGADVSP